MCDGCCFVVVCSFVFMVVVVTLFCVDVIMIPGNSFRVEGAKALAPALQSLSQLTSLNLDSA